ncbi:MAG: LPS export ABC transporter periplasmic protein LptC [Balneolaceae bacterium]|nr:LPS export ABC transporter periplasmic protein LptC [Balneolaceae bacterium]
MERHNSAPLISLICSLTIVVSVALASSSCSDLSESQSKRVQEALDDTLLSSTESWNVDMELIEEGVKKVRLRGSYAATYNFENLNETRISGPVFIQVFDSAGTVETRVTSDRAVYRADESEFELYGNVIVRTEEGRRLESEYLEWKQSDNRVSTPRFVIITTPSDSIAGNGFEGTTNLSEYTIREVTGQFVLD